MLASFVSKFPHKFQPRPAELPLEPFLWVTVAAFVWFAAGWLAHAYMMHDIRKRRFLNPSDHRLVWTCMAVAPLAAFIAFLMFITPDDKKEGM